jgi:hypothetical protein
MLNQDFKEFIQLLNENQVKYLVIGGYAVAIHDFQSPDQVIQLGYPPNRIDLITTPDGVDFQTCYNSRTEVLLSDIIVNFIDLDNLKKNKLASGRFQDLADLENLQNPQKF